MIAHIDLVGGAAGDMLLAALIDLGRSLGVDVEGPVRAGIRSLGIGCDVEITEDVRGGLRCLRVHISGGDVRQDPDRIRSALDGADASAPAVGRALAAFELLVDAEARVHGIAPSEVHLHELAEGDTPSDLLGVAVAVEALGLRYLTCGPVPLGSGRIRSAHGELPLPAPVTLELLTGMPLVGAEGGYEHVTPTAAALLRVLGCQPGPLSAMTLRGTGIGGGTRETETPNVVRVLAGDATDEGLGVEQDVLLETNIDDATPEAVGWVLEAAMDAGAKDAWVTPIVMKRSRPAMALAVLVGHDREDAVLDLVLRHTSTLGVRRSTVDKRTVAREKLTVEVRGHRVSVKIGRLGGEAVTVSPEHRDVVAAAEAAGLPMDTVRHEAAEAARRTLAGR